MDDTSIGARDVLEQTRALRARSRRLAHVGAWLPAAVLGLLPLLSIALYRHPLSTDLSDVIDYPFWAGLLTPLVPVGVAAVVLGLTERSVAIVLSGGWLLAVAWQFCALAQIGGLLGWQVWLLTGGSGPALGGQITGLGLDRPAPALLLLSLPLLLSAATRALRGRRP